MSRARRKRFAGRHLAMVLLLGAVGAQATAQPAAQEPQAERQAASAQTASVAGITEHVLVNGLRVVLIPEPSVPTITVVVTYLVGSRNEGLGETGMSHMMEHMLTKGTESRSSIWKDLADRGYEPNATTWFDRTNFFETVPATEDDLDFALRIEAERMTAALLTEDDLAEEMKVITREFEMIESDPATVLSCRMMSVAYDWHNYGKPTIGNLSDIRRYPVESLRRYYRAWYRPDNAVLVLAGRFDERVALQLAAERFGSIPNPDSMLPGECSEEPAQEGPREVVISGADGAGLAGLMYHVPAGTHPDLPALEVLREIMVGGPAGRLSRAMGENGLAAGVDAGWSDALQLAKPGVLELSAKFTTESAPDAVIARMVEVVEGAAARGFADREVELARSRLLRQMRFLVADTPRFAVELSEWIALGDWRQLFLHWQRLEDVTGADVQRVAETYLIPNNRTAGVRLPQGDTALAEPQEAMEPDYSVIETTARPGRSVGGELSGAKTSGEGAIRFSLEPGMELALKPKPNRGGLVQARLRFEYGTPEALAGLQTASLLLPQLLEQSAIAAGMFEEVDLLQAEVSIGGHTGVLTVSITSGRESLPAVLKHVREILREPHFTEEMLEEVRRERLTKTESAAASPVDRCVNALRRGLYPFPQEHFYYKPTLEEEKERLRGVTLEQVEEVWARHLGADALAVGVVGEFDTGGTLNAFAELFGSWRAAERGEPLVVPWLACKTGRVDDQVPGNPLAVAARAMLLPVGRTHEDFPALKLASYVFVEKDRARLKDRLRHQESLCYYVGGDLRADPEEPSAYWYVMALCSPDDSDEVIRILREECDHWIRDGIRDSELATAKRTFAREMEVRHADNRELAGLLSLGQHGLAFEAALLDSVNALTAAEVNDALRRHLGERELLEVVVNGKGG